MTLSGYQATGGLRGALARTAESLFATIDADQRTDARTLFVRLTALGEDGADSKRRIGWDEIDVEDTVLAAFTDARLITVDDSGIEMTHEALIHGWPRLSGWLTDDRDRLHAQRQLAEDASTWESLDSDPDSLYRGGRLAVAQELPQSELTARERGFVEASAGAERTRRHAARRRIRQLRWLSAGLAVALVSTSVFAGLMAHSQRQTEEERRIAVSRQLAAQADAAARTSPEQALRWSLDAIATAPTMEARSSVINLLGNPVSHGAIPDSGDIAVSANGGVLAVNGTHGINIWDLPHRRRIRTFDDYPPNYRFGGIDTALAISPNGDRLVVGDSDGQLRVWDPISVGAPSAKWFASDIRALAFSPDGHRLAVLDVRHSLSILDTDSLEVLAYVPGGGSAPAGKPSVVFSPDSSTVAAPADTSTVVARDTNTGQAVATLTDVQGDAPFAFNSDGRTIAAVDQAGELVAHDLTTRAVTTLARSPGRLSGLAFLPDGDLVFASVDHGIQAWEHERAEPLLLSTVTPSQLLAAGTTIVATDTKNVLIWPIDGFPQYTSEMPRALAFDTTNGSLLVSTYNGAQLERLDRSEPHTLIPPRSLNTVTDVSFSSGYRFLALPQPPHEIGIYDVVTGRRRATLNSHRGTASNLSFAANNRYLAVSYSYPSPAEGQNVVTWDIDKRHIVADLPINAAHLALAPDGRQLAATTGSRKSVVTLWGKTKIAELRSRSGRVTALSYRPDGHTLAIGHENGIVELWDTTRRQRVAELRGHTAALSEIQFSPDGTKLATVDQDSILLWDAANGNELARIHDLPAEVMTIAWRPDSDAIATALSSHAVLVFPTDTDEAVALLCQTLFTDYATQPPPHCGSR